MRTFALIFLFIFIHTNLFAQVIGYDTTILSGNDQDVYGYKYLGINAKSEKYILSTFKNYYTHGTTTLFSTLPSTNYSLSRVLFLEKYDSNNQFIWAKKIAESDTMVEYDMVVDSKDRIVVSVNYRKALKIDSFQIMGSGRNDFTLLTYNSDGTLIKYKTVSSPYFEHVSCITSDMDANIYMTGQIGYDYDTTINTPVYFDSILVPPTWDFIAKMDSNGNFCWVKDAGIERIQNMVCNGNSLYVSGVVGNMDSLLGIPTLALWYYSYFVGKIDTAGHGIWSRSFGQGNLNAGYYNEILLASNGKNVSVTANSYGFTGYTNIYQFQNGPSKVGWGSGVDCFIYTVDTNGNFVWNTASSSWGNEAYDNIAIDSAGNTYVAGSYNDLALFDSDSSFALGADDIVTVKYDPNGQYLWSKRGGGFSTDNTADIKLDHNQVPYILATTKSPWIKMGYDSIEILNTNNQLLLTRICELHEPDGIRELNAQEFVLYPNPATNKIYIKNSHWQPGEDELVLLNQNGMPVSCTKLTTSIPEIVAMDVHHLPSGIYYLTLKREPHKNSMKIIIQRK